MSDGIDNRDDIELAIVGILLREPEHMGKAMEKLTLADFSQLGAHGLFRAMGSLFLADKPIDEITVLAEAGDEYRGVVSVAAWRKDNPAQIDHYIDLLARQSRMDTIRALGSDLAAAATQEAVEGIVARLNGALSDRRSADVVSMEDGLLRFFETHGSQVKPRHLSWGFRALDENLTIGLGAFVVIGGYPSAGKTLLSLQMALALAREYRVGYFSLETGTDNLIERLLSHKTQIPLTKIKRHDLGQKEWDSLVAASQEMSALPLCLIRAGGATVSSIQAVTQQKKFQIIFVDYLQLVQAKGGNRYEQVTKISLQLHTMAQTLGVTVVALAQLSRPERTKGPPPPPNMNSFRESGQIEQDADVAMLLYPKDPDDNGSQRILKVSKNKDGPKAELLLDFHGATQTLTEAPRPVAQQLIETGKQAKQQRVSSQGVIPEFEDLTGKVIGLPF